MKTLSARRVSNAVYELAESPVWDPASGRILWVDIPAGTIHSAALESRPETSAALVDTTATVIGDLVTAITIARDGGLLVAGRRGLLTLDPSGAVHTGPDILPAHRDNRLNDGACDPSGRYLIGTLSLDGVRSAEELLQIEPSGEVSVLRTGIALSNGIGFSPNGTRVYHVDTLDQTVWAAQYDSATGKATGWEKLFTVDGGYPDGLAVDEEGLLWLAIWGGGQVRRYDTRGAIHAVITVDAPHTSSVAFVGENLERLVITTARAELTEETLRRAPDSGAIFLADPGVRGLPPATWVGSTRSPRWGAPERHNQTAPQTSKQDRQEGNAR